jgi:flagellar hook-basal body complex protein FliE
MEQITLGDRVLTSMPSPLKVEEASDNNDSFGGFLMSAINGINQAQNDADHAIQELATGKEQDIHQTMIAIEKAEVSFQLMMQVRNKIVAAYETIMRMQI